MTLRFLFTIELRGRPLRPLLAQVIARLLGELSSAVRSTVAVTGISSFPAAGNVLPSLASAQFNFRYLPGQSFCWACMRCGCRGWVWLLGLSVHTCMSLGHPFPHAPISGRIRPQPAAKRQGLRDEGRVLLMRSACLCMC